MNYRDIAFSKAKEYGLEIVEDYQFEEDKYIRVQARLDGKRILLDHPVQDAKDMLTVFHEIGHFVLGHSKKPIDLSSADRLVQSVIDWMNQEISAFDKAFELASDITFDRETIKDFIGTLYSHILWASFFILDHVKGAEEQIEHLRKQWYERLIDILMRYNLVGSEEEATEFMRKAFLELSLKDHRKKDSPL